MSYNSQALTAYKETRVKTASQGSLIIMLYDEGIKNITLALEGMPDGKIEAENIERIHQYILKAQDIITELMASLNMDDGGEIAENLLSLYSFFNQQLFQANMKIDRFYRETVATRPVFHRVTALYSLAGQENFAFAE